MTAEKGLRRTRHEVSERLGSAGEELVSFHIHPFSDSLTLRVIR